MFEKTPKYLGSKKSVQRIKHLLGESLKIVVVVCNPTLRAFSDWSHVMYSNGTGFGEKMDQYINFEDYLDKVTNELKNEASSEDYVMSIYSGENSHFSILTNAHSEYQLKKRPKSQKSR